MSGHDDAGQPFVAGVYPMLQDESCFFLAIDFDKQDWQQDVSAFPGTCREPELPAALERSRSGRGGHVWFFFEEATPATLARKLGSFLLTETMERRPDIGLDSYDRLFPNQDTLPQGGLGNLIAMPLQKQARAHGNARLDTLFITLPISWRGTVAQYVGRLHRLHGGERDVRVYDYADLQVAMLARMFDRPCRAYEVNSIGQRNTIRNWRRFGGVLVEDVVE